MAETFGPGRNAPAPVMTCPFCTVPRERLVFEGELAFVIRDGHPVSPGHMLVIPKRHVASFFETTTEEQASMLRLLNLARIEIAQQFKPAGYNVGINDGAVAGQTVAHLHIHLIPRYPGDRDDPRGGVRWVLPEKAAYWQRD